MDLTRRECLEALTVGASMTIAGCGGDGSGGQPTATPTDDGSMATPTGDESTATPTSDSGSGTTAREAYPDYEWSKLVDATPTETTEITMKNFAFDPLIAAVSPGATVTFVNEDAAAHTVTIPKLEVDRNVPGGERTTVTFEETGTYDYVCTYHGPSMLGRIVVGETAQSNGGDSGSTTTSGNDGGYYTIGRQQ